MSWTDVNLDLNLVRAVSTTSALVEGAVAVVEAGLTIMTPVVNVLARLEQQINSDIEAFDTLLDQAIDAIDLADPRGGAYVLNIPIRKVTNTVLSSPDVPVRTLADLTRLSNLRLPPAGVSGGNYGIYHAFVESLFDEGDLNRPSLSTDAYTGMLMIVYGGASYVSMLSVALDLNRLFDGLIPIPMDAYTLPVPQDTKTRIVPTSAVRTPVGFARVDMVDGNSAKSVMLRWQKIAPLTELLTFGATTQVCVDAWTVYVKEGTPIHSTDDPEDYALYTHDVRRPTSPTPGAFYQGNVFGAYVTGFDESKTYYVSVGYAVTVSDAESGESLQVEHDHATLGEQHRIVMADKNIPTKFVRGIPPDWVGISRPFDLLPSVRDLVDTAQNALGALKQGQPDTRSTLQVALEAVQANVERAGEVVSQARSTAEAVTRIGGGISGGVYVNSVIGRGGDQLLIRHVGEQLLDNNIENQPPFRTTNSVAGALSVVVQFETEAEVQAFLAPFSTLFGGVSTATQDAIEDLQPADATDVVDDVTTTPPQQLDTLGVSDEPC